MQAADLYWDLNGDVANTGTSATGAWDGINAFWNTDASGTGGTPQATTSGIDNLFFSSGTGYTLGGTVTVGAEVTANGITFEEGSITLSGAQLTLGGGGLTFSNGTVTNVINTALVLTSDAAIVNADNSLQTVTGGISGVGNLAINVNSTGGVTISGGTVNMSGDISLAGTGSGFTTISAALGGQVSGLDQNSATSRLSLTADNSAMTGAMTLSAGTLHGANLGTSNTLQAFGSGVLHLESGIALLRANGSANNAVAPVTNSAVVVSGNSTIDVNRASGSTRTGVVFALPSLTIGAAQLSVAGGNSYSLRVTGGTALTGDATFNATTANLSLAGVVDDGAGLFGFTKTGSGTLSLSQSNTFEGQVQILAGVVTASNAGALGVGSSPVLMGATSGTDTARLNLSFNALMTRDVTLQSGGTGAVRIHGSPASFENARLGGFVTLGSTNGTGRGLLLSVDSFRTLTIESVIQDPTGLIGAGASVTVDSGTVALGGDNSFSGGVVVDGGVVRAQHNNALGTGTVIVNSGALGGYGFGSGNPSVTLANNQIWNGNFSSGTNAGPGLLVTGNVSLTGSRTLLMDNTTTTYAGVIDEDTTVASYGLTFRNNGSFTANWNLNAANQFGGGVLVLGTAGTAIVNAGNAGALGSGQTRLASRSSSRLNLTADLTIDSLSTALADLTFTGGTGGTNGTQDLVFNGGGGTGAAGTATISGGAITAVTMSDYGRNYTSAPTVELSIPGGTGTITAIYQASTVTLNTRTLTIAGTNAEAAAFTGVISGAGNVIKQGAGVQILTGSNTYAGATTITGGMLQISATGSINGTSGVTLDGTSAVLQYDSSVALTKAVTFGSNGGSFIYNENAAGYSGGDLAVGAGALLGGSGRITNNVTLASGGKLSPGNSLGTLTVDGSLNLAAATGDDNGALVFSIGTGGDQVVVGGSLDVGQLDWADLNISDNGALVNGDYVLFDAASPITGSIGTASGSWSFFTGTLSIDNTNNDVVLTVVPEPASLSLIGLAAAGLLSRRRRRVN